MTSEKLHSLVTELASILARHQGNKTTTVNTLWLRRLFDTLSDCVDQVEALETADQINVHARDALVRIFNDAERWLERSRAANLEATVKALAADNAP